MLPAHTPTSTPAMTSDSVSSAPVVPDDAIQVGEGMFISKPAHPLSVLGSLDASAHYCVRLHGLVPLHPSALPAPGETRAARFALAHAPLHPHARPKNLDEYPPQHLPQHPRNALVLSNLRTLSSLPGWPATHNVNSTDTNPHPPITQHPPTPDHSPYSVTAPNLPYPMQSDSMEFFPLSSLRLPPDATSGHPLDLTHWFVADCLAAAHTYTKLMTAPAHLPQPRDITGMDPTRKLNNYSELKSGARTFWPGGAAYDVLMEGTLYPTGPAYNTADTADMNIAHVITSPPNAPVPLPRSSSWFRLIATPRLPTADDVGPLGEQQQLGSASLPTTHFATWVDYTLSTPQHSMTFDAPYFSPASYQGLLYKHAVVARDRDNHINNIRDQAAEHATGHALEHSLPDITKTYLFQEARDYASTLSTQRQNYLVQWSRQAPAKVVYSDLYCFTTSGRYDLTRPIALTPLLTRVNLPPHYATSSEVYECVATQAQYRALHHLMTQRYIDDAATLAGATAHKSRISELTTNPVIDKEMAQGMKGWKDPTKYLRNATMARTAAQAAVRDTRAALGDLSSSDATTDSTASLTPQAPRKRGRPPGSRVAMSAHRMIGKIATLGLMAGNVLQRHATKDAAHPYATSTKILRSHINPTDNWTRLTPLMPVPATHPLATAEYGRALPIRAVNNQHIDSLLWRSLLNAWVSRKGCVPFMETSRIPLLQVTALPESLDPRTAGLPTDYVNGTKFAYAVIHIPVPASVMHEWLVTGPSKAELDAILPKAIDHAAPAPDDVVRKGYYTDPDATEGAYGPQHTRLAEYPEALVAGGLHAVNTLEAGVTCLAQPSPQTARNTRPEDIDAGVDLSSVRPR